MLCYAERKLFSHLSKMDATNRYNNCISIKDVTHRKSQSKLNQTNLLF